MAFPWDLKAHLLTYHNKIDAKEYICYFPSTGYKDNGTRNNNSKPSSVIYQEVNIRDIEWIYRYKPGF